jgi:hypothetical protein
LGGDGGVRFWDHRQLRGPDRKFEVPQQKFEETTRPMTPSPPFREKPATLSDFGAREWLLLATGILSGALAAALAAFFTHAKDLALGFFLGGLLSFLNFRVLYVMAVRVLSPGGKGRRFFWFWTFVRWIGFALVCGFLVRVSLLCLLGALGSYVWSLVVLVLVSLKSLPSKNRH